MSTIRYPLNGTYYQIGAIGWEWSKEWSRRISEFSSSIVPTYGAWAGPGWAANERPLKSDDIKWADEPCMNDSIRKSGAGPSQCYSLVDAICKWGHRGRSFDIYI